MKNTNRSPFIYPVYIVQVLNQLMEDSVKNRNGILSKRADIVEILYNQFNNFPITEQVYQMMWVWIIKMLNAGHYDWIKQRLKFKPCQSLASLIINLISNKYLNVLLFKVDS